MKYAFSLSFCYFKIKRYLAFYYWLWYFDQTPACEIKTNQSWKSKSVFIVEMIERLLK
jgi:hypothetical protein